MSSEKPTSETETETIAVPELEPEIPPTPQSSPREQLVVVNGNGKYIVLGEDTESETEAASLSPPQPEPDETMHECKTCNRAFRLDEKEKEWYISKAFHLPKHCAPCRRERRKKRRFVKPNRTDEGLVVGSNDNYHYH